MSLGGVVDGKIYLRPETVDRIFEEQISGKDLVLEIDVRYGLGFGIASPDKYPDWTVDGKIATWGGWGGSMCVSLDDVPLLPRPFLFCGEVGLRIVSTQADISIRDRLWMLIAVLR